MATAINMDEFTLEELEKLEQLTGLTFTEIAKDFQRPRVISAVLWLNALRSDPGAKIEDFKKLTIGEASALFVGAEEDPKAE
jgi:hypothetical protein